ncbi:MAG: hypothetical protein AB2375_03255 [Tissierellaceae bacterium]
MNFDNIIEKRTVENGLHSLVLEISADEYNKSYDECNREIASEILSDHLYTRGDDGRPANIKIKEENNENIIKIFADIHYLDNDHTTYGRH